MQRLMPHLGLACANGVLSVLSGTQRTEHSDTLRASLTPVPDLHAMPL